jgi:hypothetical protein
MSSKTSYTVPVRTGPVHKHISDLSVICLAEAISSIIWVAPRMQTDVAELKVVADQLAAKYGKPYAQVGANSSSHNIYIVTCKLYCQPSKGKNQFNY